MSSTSGAPTYEVFWGIFVSAVAAVAASLDIRYELIYDVVLSGR